MVSTRASCSASRRACMRAWSMGFRGDASQRTFSSRADCGASVRSSASRFRGCVHERTCPRGACCGARTSASRPRCGCSERSTPRGACCALCSLHLRIREKKIGVYLKPQASKGTPIGVYLKPQQGTIHQKNKSAENPLARREQKLPWEGDSETDKNIKINEKCWKIHKQ